MISEKGIEHLSLISPSIKENTSIQKEVLSKAKQTMVYYKEILMELKRQNQLLERLEKSGRIVTVSK